MVLRWLACNSGLFWLSINLPIIFLHSIVLNMPEISENVLFNILKVTHTEILCAKKTLWYSVYYDVKASIPNVKEAKIRVWLDVLLVIWLIKHSCTLIFCWLISQGTFQLHRRGCLCIDTKKKQHWKYSNNTLPHCIAPQCAFPSHISMLLAG